MPDPALIAGTAAAHLEMLPPVLRDDPSYQAVIYALANEVDRLEAAIETARAQFNPLTADVLLKAWEVMTQVTAEPSGQTLAQRRATVQAMLLARAAAPTGLSWEEKVSAIVGPGWSYQEYQPPDERLTNLAPNPGFEYAGPADAVFSGGGAAVNQHGRDTVWADTGTHSYHAKATFGGPPGFAMFYFYGDGAIAVDAGKTYTAVVRLKADSLVGNCSMQIVAENAGGASLGVLGTTEVVTLDSHEIVASGITPAGTVTLSPLFIAQNASGGVVEVHIDSVTVTKGPGVPPYFSGDDSGFEWVGAPGVSASRAVPPPQGTIRITLPYPPTSDRYMLTERVLRQITRAGKDIQLQYAGGFVTDVSQLDQEGLG